MSPSPTETVERDLIGAWLSPRLRFVRSPVAPNGYWRLAQRRPRTRPQPGERVHREIKLLVDHRDDLVDERRRTQQRLRWHLHELDPTLVVPLRRLDRASHLERVGRWLARREQEVQVRIARELVARCRSLTRAIDELNQELEQRAAAGRAGAARTPRLRRRNGCEAASRDRPDQPLQKRRTTRTP